MKANQVRIQREGLKEKHVHRANIPLIKKQVPYGLNPPVSRFIFL
jgi:hypothetical protein